MSLKSSVFTAFGELSLLSDGDLLPIGGTRRW